MENINVKTLEFLSLLNELAEDSKGGFLPLDAYNGTQPAIVYDPNIEFEERGTESTRVYPVVSAVGFPDGERVVYYYGEDDESGISEEYQVFVEVETNPHDEYPAITCAVYLRDHETEAKLGDAATGPLYRRIRVEDGEWTIT